MSADDPKQRLMAIRVGEVSLVDAPANEEEFIIIKGLNNDDIVVKAEWSSAFINDLPDSSFLYIEPGGKKDADGKTVPRSLRHFPYKDGDGNVDMPHLRNALSRIPQSNLSDDVKNRATVAAQRAMENATKKDKVTKMSDTENKKPNGDVEISTLLKSMSDIEALIKGKKMPPEMKERMEKLVSTVKEMMDEDDAKGKVQKAAEIADGDVVLRPDGVIVMKGGKQFTKERLTKLRDSIAGLVGMMKDVDADTFGQMFAAFNPPMGGAPAVASGATATPAAAVAKSNDQPPAWAKGIMDAVEAVTKRLDTVEKTTTAPKALPQNGNDNTADKTVKKSFWSGVL